MKIKTSDSCSVITFKVIKGLMMKYQLGESHENDIACTALYKPNMDCFSPSIIACFIISDGWNEQMLRELKEKTDAYLLVGLQTADSQFEDLNIIDGVIKCQPYEVRDVAALLDVKAASSIIGIDVVDVKSLFECGYSFQFIQVSATGKPESDMIKEATHELVSQVPKAYYIKGLLLAMQTVESPSLDNLSYISETVKKSLSVDEAYVYYSTRVTDEQDCFRLKAIYALI